MNLEALHHTFVQKLVSDAEGLRALLAPNAVVEFPYAPSIGLSGRLEGRDAIVDYFRGVSTRLGFSGFRFTNVRTHPCADPDAAWFEMHGTADLPGGKVYEQDYVQYLRVEDGLVAHYKEYWNMVPVLEVRA